MKRCEVGDGFSLISGRLLESFRSVTGLLWPARCRVCREMMQGEPSFLCETCWDRLSAAVRGHYCRRCGKTVSPYGLLPGGCGHCIEQPPKYDGILRVGLYESVLRRLILLLKFREQTETIEVLGSMLRTAWEAGRIREHVDCLVPVPLHWRRRLERGYNQSFLLARSLRSPIPIFTDLVRMRYTRRQWNLTDAQRRRNVKGAFAVRKDHRFSGRVIGLVDDITTSGATLNECAVTLKKAGARAVYAIVTAAAENIE